VIRLGLIGAQFIGNLYVYSLRQVPGAIITAVASPNTAAGFAARHDIPAHFADYRAMIRSADIDAVAIAAPNDLHFDVCLAAAEGQACPLRKPLAMSLAQSDRMIEACCQAGVILFTPRISSSPHTTASATSRTRVDRPAVPRQAGPVPRRPLLPWFWMSSAWRRRPLDMGCHSIHSICHTMGEWLRRQ
jgi:predicted dehydrogenase